MFAAISSAVSANPGVEFYKIDVQIEESGRSNVQLVMNFEKPEDTFSMNIIGKVENFQFDTNALYADCDVATSGTSSIYCDLGLTETKKELRINFTTDDFVKSLDDKYYFSASLGPKISVNHVSATIRLPQNTLLTGDDISSSIISYTQNASAHIMGDSIIIIWNLKDISSDAIKFDVLYERVNPPAWFQFRMSHFILLGGSFAAVVGIIIVLYLRRSKNVVLSVLDEYERKVMDVISKEGEVKQKQVVNLTNLSKAKVSRVVKSLADRGLVETERRGRTNILRNVKKKLNP